VHLKLVLHVKRDLGSFVVRLQRQLNGESFIELYVKLLLSTSNIWSSNQLFKDTIFALFAPQIFKSNDFFDRGQNVTVFLDEQDVVYGWSVVRSNL